MTDYETILIEQDPKCDERFRITLREDEVSSYTVATNTGFVCDHELSVRLVKRALGQEAAKKLREHPARAWALEHGGSTTFCRITYRPKGERLYRAGLSITFNERDRAALFKLSHVGR